MLTVPPDDESPTATTARRRRRAFFIICAVVLLISLVVFRGVLLPFFFAVVLAYLLTPVVSFVERRTIGDRPIPRWAAVLGVYTVLLALLAAFSALGAPRLAREVESLSREAPQMIATLRDEWVPRIDAWISSTFTTPEAPVRPQTEPAAPEVKPAPGIVVRPVEADGGYHIELPEEGLVIRPHGEGYTVATRQPPSDNRGELDATLSEALRTMSDDTQTYTVAFLKTARRFIGSFVRGVFTFFIVLMLSAYLIATRDNIAGFFRSMVRTDRQDAFDNLVVRIDRGLSGVVRGQLGVCFVNGVLSGIGFALLDLRYWPILTLIAGVMSIIPIFGSILSTVPVVVIALQQGVGTAALAVGWIVVIHQIEANLLNPKILGDAARLHPVLIIFALLAGEHLFGIAGAILAVPVLSIVQSLFLHFRQVALGVPAPRRATSRPPRGLSRSKPQSP